VGSDCGSNGRPEVTLGVTVARYKEDARVAAAACNLYALGEVLVRHASKT